MKVEIKIPSMGESVSGATVSSIIKPTGSFVKTDEEILELETDKVNQVLYAPQTGQLSLNIQVGDNVTIGQVIGYVETEAKPLTPTAAPSATPPAKEKPLQGPSTAASAPSLPKVESSGPSPRKTVSEFVREVQTPSPAVTPAEPKSAPAPSAPAEKVSRKKMSGLRKVIAQKLVEAKNTTAMLTTFNEIDMTEVIEIRSREKDAFLKRYGVKLGFMSFFVKGVVAALKAIPQVNGYIDGDEIVTLSSYDIGIAVSTEKGLMVPVVRNCDLLTYGGVEQAIEEFSKKARTGGVSVDDLRGGSFTITNGGVFGSLLSTPIINYPQSAILGMHSIVKRAVVVNDQIVIRPMMYVALSYDHRIIDGKEAVLFLVHLKQSLEEPARLLLDL